MSKFSWENLDWKQMLFLWNSLMRDLIIFHCRLLLDTYWVLCYCYPFSRHSETKLRITFRIFWKKSSRSWWSYSEFIILISNFLSVILVCLNNLCWRFQNMIFLKQIISKLADLHVLIEKAILEHTHYFGLFKYAIFLPHLYSKNVSSIFSVEG